MVAKKMDVPDIGSLLGKIAEKRDSGEIPRTQRQHVTPVREVEEESRKEVKTAKRENSKTTKSAAGESSARGGRPSVKQEGIEYVKISPRIPKSINQRAKFALAAERFQDGEGRAIKTLDELVAMALDKLLPKTN
jgi:hypothetical protein